MDGSKLTAPRAILSALASDNRHVLSLWRGLIYLRRASFRLNHDERRWSIVPDTEADLTRYIKKMIQDRDLEKISGSKGVYRVTTPFAQGHSLDIREVLFEAHAYTVLSHFSALDFHGLTSEQPKVITAMSAAKAIPDVLPLGTDATDWEDISLPSTTRPDAVLGHPVRWVTVELSRLYGYSVYSPLGVPYRVTSPERTLVDALQKPEICGGIANVLRAWIAGRDMIDPSLVEQYTERYDIALLRQRVGYIMEAIGFTDPTLDGWARSSRRGGSSKLVGSEPFASNYSERWNLSLNAPVHVLHELAAT